MAAEWPLRMDDAGADGELPSAKLRILFLIDEIGSLDGGGTERQVLQLIRLSKRLGYDPRLAVLRGSECLHEGNAGCPVYRAGVSSWFDPLGWRGARDLVRWMREERIVLVQTFFVESNIIGPLLARLAGVPVVIGTRRNLDQFQGRTAWLRPVIRLIQRLANRMTACVVANSEEVSETMIRTKRVPRHKMRVAYNGIDLARFDGLGRYRFDTRQLLGVGEDEVLVGNVSCMRPVKGLLQFVDAARIVLEKDSEMQFILVGGGDQWDEITEHIRQLGLENHVHLVGAQTNVLPYLSAMDIGVLSSFAEGFSNSLLEYMASGLPAVATDVGGNCEALGNAGILVPSDDPAALAEAILRLRSPMLRQQLGQAAFERARQFGLGQAERRMEEIYGEMLNSKGVQRNEQ